MTDLFGRFLHEAKGLKPFVPTYLHLLSSTIFLLYTGAHASLSRPSSAAEPQKRNSRKAVGSEEDDDDEDAIVAQKMEGLSPSDALLFPVLAGATLASLYFLIKWLKDPAVLNKVLNYYFSQVGLVFAVKLLKDALSISRSIVFPLQYQDDGFDWRINKRQRQYEAIANTTDRRVSARPSPLPGSLARKVGLSRQTNSLLWTVRETLYTRATLHFQLHRLLSVRTPIDILDAAAVVFAIPLIGIFTFIVKPWYLTNFLGFSFCYGSLQYMSPTTFWTGTMLLSALFFYDIYFVFFTPMMVTVATKLDIPIKLLFPRPAGPGTDPTKQALAMLGLGDIVVPGIMIALALRFDLYLHYLGKQTISDGKAIMATYHPATGSWGERFWVGLSEQSGKLQAKSFPKPYFTASIVGYVVGMGTTLVVMQISDHAQPALLYLVPGVLLSLWGAAFVRGDVKKMWEFTEGDDERPEKKTAEGKKNEEKSSLDTSQERVLQAKSSKHEKIGDTGSHASSWDELNSDQPQLSSTKKGGEAADLNTEDSNVPAKSQSSSTSESPNGESKSRQLVLLSITLPPSSSRSKMPGEDRSTPRPIIDIDSTTTTDAEGVVRTNLTEGDSKVGKIAEAREDR